MIDILNQVADLLALAPEPTTPAGPGPDIEIIDTAGIVKFGAQFIAPVLLAFLGIWILARSSRGEVSRAATSTGIALLGVALLVGGGSLLLIGDDLVELFIAG